MTEAQLHERLVLADRLMSQGDPLGFVVSLQCRQFQLGPALEPSAAEELRALWHQHRAELCARAFGGEGHLAFEGGIATSLSCGAAEVMKHPLPTTLTRLEVSDVAPSDLPAVLWRAHGLPLTSLRLRAVETTPFAASSFAALAQTPQLQHLGLFGLSSEPRGLRDFFLSARIQKLNTLELDECLGSNWAELLPLLPMLDELCLNETVPLAALPSLARHRVLLWRSGWLMREVTAQLVSRGDVYLTHTPGFTRAQSIAPPIGRWHRLSAIGARPGLDATLVHDPRRGQGGLLVRTQTVSADALAPHVWLDEPLQTLDFSRHSLGPIDRGLSPEGEWAVFAITAGRRCDSLMASTVLPLSASALAAAFAPIAERAARTGALKAASLHSLFLGPDGLREQPISGELHWPIHDTRIIRPSLVDISPEAARGLKLTDRHVTWQVAMQLCASLRIHPFAVPLGAVPDAKWLMELINGDPVSMRGRGLPEPLAQMLERCFIRDPAARPPVSALAAVLATFDSPQARAELSQLPGATDTFSAAHAQAECWLHSMSQHQREPLT